MADVDRIAVAQSIREAIEESPKKSKRVLLKTLLKMYGHKTKQRHWVEAMAQSLSDAGIIISPHLIEIDRDEWVILSVTDPHLPVADFSSTMNVDEQGNKLLTSADSWLECIAEKVFNSEKEVEIRFVLPLLERL